VAGWIQYGWNHTLTPVEKVESLMTGRTLVHVNTEPTGAWVDWPQEVLNASNKPMTMDQVDNALRAAVQSRLEADAPIGCFLSGGIDSALIAKYASEVRQDIGAFTVRMPHDEYDESNAAARTAEHLGIQHTILDCDPRPAEDLIHTVAELGLPFGDSSLLPSLWVSRAAASHVRVALAGDGGDELFLGYDRHRAIPLLAQLAQTPGLAKRLAASVAAHGRNPRSRITRVRRLLDAALHKGYKELVAIFPTPMLHDLGIQIQSIRHSGMTIASDPEAAERTARRFDLLFYLPEDLLRKTDTASMSAPLEVRAPFLDSRVARPAINAPASVLMPNGQRKGLLKQVARRYLPDEIINRPKQGFAIPIGDWFRTDFGDMRQLLYDHLQSADPFPGLADAGVDINMNFVNRMLREHDAAGERSINPWRGRDHSQRLYMLLVLSIWAKWLASLTADHRTDQ
jgi:asparagine synthase (glutamine-hydrolysing)